MATLDQLSAEQRAIVELVLQQGKSYSELADMLGMPEARVRELARQALVELAPVSVRAVEEDWRGQLADYVLGQQAGSEATATKGHLRRSEAARSWTRSLLDSLDQLYPNGSMPAIPEGERGRRAAGPKPAATGLAAPADAGVKRRRLLAAAG
ncbi:MAG TPA: sigma factor-like helix-turn-helix DNA-binding protein, partial [Thermoleophilaceae bacterium]|nr:sigma factor-like helix-turn-helix DNA-binding protein [Thermoleophilaceae bacterium]